MRNKLLIIIALFAFTQAHGSSELTEILFKRDSTFEQRQEVSNILGQQGKLQPLKVVDAVAEACYGVDLCAALTEISEYPNYCGEENDPDHKIRLGDECYSKFFKEQYACNSDITKQSASTVDLAGRLIIDLSTLYNSYTFEYILDALSAQYNVDFRMLSQNPSALDDFFKKNPLAKIRIETLTKETISLAAYTLDCYSKLNSYLYSKSSKEMGRYYNLYKAIINTMSLFPEYKGKVNRGVNLPKAILQEHHKIGNIVCYNGFTSTAVHDPKTDMTHKPRNGFLSGRCTQRLYISYDDSASGGKSISKGSSHQSENEILFEPGSCFRIDNVFERTDPPMEDEWEMECGEGEHYNFEMTLVR
jgi:hypothetical protein